MSADTHHPDIVAFVAGLGDPDEARATAAHLETCAECRIESGRLHSMREALRRAAAGRHPPEETLVSYDEGGGVLDPPARAAIESHLDRCGDCRDDLAALARAGRARRPAGWSRPAALPAGASWRTPLRFVTAAAAVAVLAGAVTAIMTWHGGAGRDGSPQGPAAPVTFMPPKRGGAEDRHLQAGGRVPLRVVLPVGAPEGSYRIRIEREDGVTESVPAESVQVRNESVLVVVATPTRLGAYRLVLDPVSIVSGERYLYPFRVEPAPGNDRRDGS